MPTKARTAREMIAGMSPVVRPGRFIFATSRDLDRFAGLVASAVAIFREDEGLSLVLPEEVAVTAGLATDQPMCCITLEVFSSLDGVGLTAAVSGALAARGIPCNVIAAYHHDHVFVPADSCDEAMQVLTRVQDGAP